MTDIALDERPRFTVAAEPVHRRTEVDPDRRHRLDTAREGERDGTPTRRPAREMRLAREKTDR